MLITPGIHGSESPLPCTPTEDLFQASCYCDAEPREGRESAGGKLCAAEVVSSRCIESAQPHRARVRVLHTRASDASSLRPLARLPSSIPARQAVPLNGKNLPLIRTLCLYLKPARAELRPSYPRTFCKGLPDRYIRKEDSLWRVARISGLPRGSCGVIPDLQ